MLAQRVPHPVKRAHRQHFWQPGQAHPPHHRQRRAGLVTVEEGVFEHLENAPRLGGEGGIAARGIGPGKAADSVDAGVCVGKQIEVVAGIIPPMTGEDIGLADGDMIIKPRSAGGKDFVEHAAIGENRGPAVDLDTVHRHAPRLAADPRFLLEHGDIRPARGEQSGAGQPAYACSDDGDSRVHLALAPVDPAIIIDLTAPSVQLFRHMACKASEN